MTGNLWLFLDTTSLFATLLSHTFNHRVYTTSNTYYQTPNDFYVLGMSFSDHSVLQPPKNSLQYAVVRSSLESKNQSKVFH